jgi:hypothetical protein
VNLPSGIILASPTPWHQEVFSPHYFLGYIAAHI